MGSIGSVRKRPLVVGLAAMGLGVFGLALPTSAAPVASGTNVDLTSGTSTQSRWTISNGNGTVNGQPSGTQGTGSDCTITTGLPGLGVDEGTYDIGGANRIDAFDDGLLFFVNGHQVVAGTNWDVQTDPSDGTLNRILTAGPVTTGGLSTTVEYRALPNQQVLRSLVTLANPGAAAVTIPFTVATNFGSDSNTTVEGSSSGDKTLTDADRWLVTSDNGAHPDPVNTSVLGGPGQVAAPPTATSQTVFDCSDVQGVQATYSVTIPAGGTRALMFFNEMSLTAAGAVSTAARFSTNPAVTDELLSGLSEAQRDSIVNWRLTESQPDGLIRKPHAPYIGNNIYNTTAKKQTVRSKARRGELQKFFVRIYNDGATRTTFTANGISSAKKVSVRYFVGRTDVTAAMKSSQGLSFPLAPGEFKQIKIKMKIARSADAGVRKFAKVYATSASSGIVKQDAVKAMLIARG